MRKSWALLVLFSSSAALAAPCPPAPSPMAPIVGKLRPFWTDGPINGVPGGLGMWHLMGDPATTVCGSCHTTANAGDPAYKQYVQCGQCHTTNLADWLNMSTRDQLKRESYYSPGRTKAQAVAARVADGTMPPFKNPPGWCDEIQNVWGLWIVNGMPE